MTQANFPSHLAAALRLRTLPLPLLPVIVASAAASREGSIAWSRLGIVALVVVCLHLAGILITDLFDHRAGTDKLARLDRSALPTGSLQLEAGSLSVRQILITAFILLDFALLGVIVLADVSLLILGAVGLVLITQHSGPPLRLAYLGGGLGELSLAAAYGPLPAIATMIALTESVQPGVVWISCVIGALTAMGFGTHHLLHWRSDRAATKRTPAVVYGEEGALAFFGIVDMLAFVGLAAGVVSGHFPVFAIVGVLAAPIIGVTWRRALTDPLPQPVLQLIGAHLGAAVIVSISATVGFLA